MTNLSNWEEVITNVKSINKSSIIGGEELIKEMILVNQTDSEVQIMDEKTYELKIVKKPKKINFSSKKLKIITIEDQIYLFPQTNA